MIFRTETEGISPIKKLDTDSKVLTIGSCFSDTLGDFLLQNKLQCLANPYGNSYNPVSIAKLLQLTMTKELTDDGILENNGQYFHFDFHSEITAKSSTELKQKLKNKIDETSDFLSKASFLTITLGTAFVYKSLTTKATVNNCHKVPNKLFTKELLSVHDITESLGHCIQTLQQFNPDLQIILTVSPVRHTKDGIINNQLSKSILRVACAEIIEAYPHVSYFPAYELMMDDLRDYRFYAEDLIHVNEVGKKYILNYFQEIFCTSDLQNWLEKWGKIAQKINHRAFNNSSPEHQKFLNKLLQELKSLEPSFDVKTEIMHISSQIL